MDPENLLTVIRLEHLKCTHRLSRRPAIDQAARKGSYLVTRLRLLLHKTRSQETVNISSRYVSRKHLQSVDVVANQKSGNSNQDFMRRRDRQNGAQRQPSKHASNPSCIKDRTQPRHRSLEYASSLESLQRVPRRSPAKRAQGCRRKPENGSRKYSQN